MAVKTPLKWVGSKARLMPQLLPHLPEGKRLIEPFAGSCAVMMNTDYDEYLISELAYSMLQLLNDAWILAFFASCRILKRYPATVSCLYGGGDAGW